MEPEPNAVNRREFMARSLTASAAGILAGLSLEERALLARQSSEGDPPRSEPSSGKLETGTIGKLKISRLICGGNLFSGFAHSRKLIYVSALMKKYFTPEKIMETLELCEGNGINTAILRCDAHIIGILERYRKERGGKIQWIAQTYPKVEDLTGNIRMAIDNGAVGAFMQGGIGDSFAGSGRTDLIEKVLSFLERNGLIAGVGAHSLETLRAVEKEGLKPDFYFKTLNNVDYHSEKPEEVAGFMATVEKPWIAFKVLGAGEVKPRDGFEVALKAGADFLNVGMFDFQVQEDAVAMRGLLAGNLDRARPWKS